MLHPLGEVTLKSGARASAAVVRGPDAAWHDRLTRFLSHKGDPWNWQNSALLSHEVGVEAWFYILHRDGAPFAHQMIVERNGVGIFGHVWTDPADRGQGAATELMRVQMAHFRQRQGRALYLSTGYDTQPFRLYQKHGFIGLEPNSGYMTWTERPLAEFEADYFSPGPAVIEPLAWPHWATAPALFMSNAPGLIRCAPLKLIGRKSPEGHLLPALQARESAPAAASVFVLRKPNGAVVGLAAWAPDELSPDLICADVFCHPSFWTQASALLEHTLDAAPRRRCVAYADTTCPQKVAALQAQGFQLSATWPQRLTGAAGPADLQMLTRA